MTGKQFRDSPEFDLIARYFFKHAVSGIEHSDYIDLSVGDDAAVVRAPEGHSLVFSIDTQVEGRHFPIGFPAELIAHRALASALSDLAAMGAKAHHFTLALTLPHSDADWLTAFSGGLFALAEQLNVRLVGGDTTKGPLAVTIQVHGFVPNNAYISRRGALIGDEVYVTGPLGDAGAGLAIALECMQDQRFECLSLNEQYLFERFAKPVPPLTTGEAAREYASAGLDISDGLLADLQQLCCASSVSCTVDIANIPLSEQLLAYAGRDRALSYALSAGDDYELLLTLPSSMGDHAARLGLIKLGCITERHSAPCVVLLKNGERHILPNQKGFDHFE